jgi:hypothetical protein
VCSSRFIGLLSESAESFHYDPAMVEIKYEGLKIYVETSVLTGLKILVMGSEVTVAPFSRAPDLKYSKDPTRSCSILHKQIFCTERTAWRAFRIRNKVT